jgi:hypothetical protein
MGWKEAINTYPSSIVYEIHGWDGLKKVIYINLSSVHCTGTVLNQPVFLQAKINLKFSKAGAHCKFVC